MLFVFICLAVALVYLAGAYAYWYYTFYAPSVAALREKEESPPEAPPVKAESPPPAVKPPLVEPIPLVMGQTGWVTFHPPKGRPFKTRIQLVSVDEKEQIQFHIINDATNAVWTNHDASAITWDPPPASKKPAKKKAKSQ